MSIRYENLDHSTRQYMLEEISLGNHYESPRLTAEGKANWPNLILEAAKSHNDEWLSRELRNRGYIRSSEDYTRNGITRSRKINIPSAALQLAEGEFNRFYLRGLCLRARAEGKDYLIIYRGKAVSNPRPESQAKIGARISIDILLIALRKNDFVTIEDALGVPGGPNSGLTCKLP